MSGLRPHARRARALLRRSSFGLRTLSLRRDKRISAVVRVKNEERFLHASVRSIIDIVDEVLLIDNVSTDGTPDIIAALHDEFPGTVRSYRYPFEVARAGRESRAELAARGPDSPHLLATYYDWCLRGCTQPYVLKWDADMIAVDAFDQAVKRWRNSHHVSMWFHGVEVHRDMHHCIAPFEGHHDVARGIARTADDPRMFPRRRAYYTMGRMTEELVSPFVPPRIPWAWRLLIEEPLYLHMKFCKSDPLSNVSAGEWPTERLAAISVPGAPLPAAWRETLVRLGVKPTTPIVSGLHAGAGTARQDD